MYQAKSKWKLLPPRPMLGKLKPLSSAETELNILSNGVTELKIYHDLLKGISPEMLLWWFRNIGGEMEVNGQTYSRYHIWHPIDHIHWELIKPSHDGTVGVGAEFYIVECFGGDMRHFVNSIETVSRLDLTGITLRKYMLGQEVFSLSHDFIPESGGSRYVSRMLVGASSLFGQALINPVLRWQIFPEVMGKAWLKHNVEEVGNFENFLPQLWAKHC